MACIVGDGEAETGALAASWHSNKFLNPARDGARHGHRADHEIQSVARSAPDTVERPRWPMIVFRTPKGWTGPKFVDGKPVPVEIVSPITPGRCFTNQSWA